MTLKEAQLPIILFQATMLCLVVYKKEKPNLVMFMLSLLMLSCYLLTVAGSQQTLIQTLLTLIYTPAMAYLSFFKKTNSPRPLYIVFCAVIYIYFSTILGLDFETPEANFA